VWLTRCVDTETSVADSTRLSASTTYNIRFKHHQSVGISLTVHRVSKNSQNSFYHNFVNFSPTLIIFGIKMAKTIELCKVDLFSTSP